MKKAILPLSADPFTFGHLHILYRCLKKFDFIYLLISNNYSKDYLLTKEEKYFLTKKIIDSDKNLKQKVAVISYDGGLAHFAIKNEVSFIVRGYRNKTDLEYEKSLNFYNRQIYPLLKTLYIKSARKYRFISSSSVKILLHHQLEIYKYVPLVVKKFLEQKKNIYCIGVTGTIASGKTTFCEIASKQIFFGKKVHHVNFDKVVAKIYNDISKDKFPLVKKK